MSPATAFVALLTIGAAWGLSMPLTKIAVSTGYKPFGLIFWQLVITSAIFLVMLMFRRRPPVMRRRHLYLMVVIALFGTLIPNTFSYIGTTNLPAGVMAIVMSLVPMSALAIALSWGNETFAPLRLIGLGFGLAAMIVLIGPEASLPDPTKWPFVLVGALATLCYGLEGNYVARYGTDGLDPVELLLGASVLGIPVAAVLAVGTGQFIDPFVPWAAPEFALVASSSLHVVAYVGYLWLVANAGAVFAAQVSYPVTLFGVLAAMAALGERYTGWIWFALILMMAGLALVQPKAAPAQVRADVKE